VRLILPEGRPRRAPRGAQRARAPAFLMFIGRAARAPFAILLRMGRDPAIFVYAGGGLARLSLDPLVDYGVHGRRDFGVRHLSPGCRAVCHPNGSRLLFVPTDAGVRAAPRIAGGRCQYGPGVLASQRIISDGLSHFW